MNYVYQYVKFKSTSNFTLPSGEVVDEFILSTQQDDLGYGSSDRAILNKNLTIGEIRYQVSRDGLQQVQNTSISFSNVGQFYHAMRELNGDDFWSTLAITIYWANGRVPTLMFDGADWLEDGETIVAFTPDETYPLTTDYIKKEFEGSLSSASENREKVTFSLVSKSKQDAYLIGSIKSFNGADSSRSLINPIVLGDLTDENAYIPLILKNKISSKSSAICSDIDLSEAPTPFIYDDENEKFHQVINDQEAIDNNKQIEFVDISDSESFTVNEEYVIQTKDTALTDGPVLNSLTTGEIVGYYTDDKEWVLFNDYDNASEYNIQTTTGRLRDEGTRDFNNDGVYINGTNTGYHVDSDMAIGVAKLNLTLYPINIKTTDAKGDDISNPSGSSLGGYYGFTQDPGGSNDFDVIENYQYPSRAGYLGAFKNVINYREQNMRDPLTRPLPDYENASDSLWFAAHARDLTPLSSSWEFYNYNNKLRVGLTAEYENFKFDSAIEDLDFWVLGAVYKNWETSNDVNAFDFSGVGFTPAESTAVITYEEGITTINSIVHDNSDVGEGTYNINGFLSGQGLYPNLSDFYNNPPVITFNGYTTYQPVKSTSAGTFPPVGADCFLDRADPSFYGSSRFALDGIRVDAQVKANVESKYWCFKGKTGDAQTLGQGLNTLATRYENPAFTSADMNRASWQMAGAHTGNPVYYRDIIAKICDEFRVFITDRNGSSEIVSMGLSTDANFTIDESVLPTPWNSKISFGETEATEIYNKMVIRYAKNHMTGRYGKTVSITKDEIQRTEGIPTFEDVDILQAYLSIADSSLSKIGITEKVKTIDLDWVRDDFTANQILKWWCGNSNKQRAVISAEVSKLTFIDAKIGDIVDLSLPSLPLFYQKNYQIKKIVNRSDKKLLIEAEEIVDVVEPVIPPYMEDIKILFKDGSNIIVDGEPIQIFGTANFNGYEVDGITSAELKSSSFVYTDTSPISMSAFVKYGESFTLDLSGNGAPNTGEIRLALDTGGRLRLFTNFGAVGSSTVIIKPSGSYLDFLYIHYVIDNERVKIYLNTDVSNVVNNTMRLVYDQPISRSEYNGSGTPRVFNASYDYNKFSAWNRGLPLEEIQSWYDIGPTADPDGI